MADVGSLCRGEKETRSKTRKQNKGKNDCEHCLQIILTNAHEAGIIELAAEGTAASDLTQVTSLEDVKVDLKGTKSLHIKSKEDRLKDDCGQLGSAKMQRQPSSFAEKRVLSFEKTRIATRQRLNKIVEDGEVSWPGHNTPQLSENNEVMVRTRRCGMVEASDGASRERCQTRVLRKKFGEGLMPEKCDVFNKKL